MRLTPVVVAVLLIAATAAVPAQAGPITPQEAVANWSRQSDPIGANNVNAWIVNGAFVEYTTNNGGSLISDVQHLPESTFSARIATTGADNDRFGIVFGWQNSANNYRFSWEGGGFDDVGFDGLNLIREVGGVSTSLLTLAGNYWQAGVSYDVTLGRQGSDIVLIVDQVGGGNITTFSIQDTTFVNGSFGLFTNSQTTRFSNMVINPEPGTFALFGLGLAGLVYTRRRMRRSRTSA